MDAIKALPQNGKVIAEYIWIDGAGSLRAKCRTLDKYPKTVEDLPEWNYDGSSTYQATTENSEIIMKPVFFFPDPFRGGDNIMVLTDQVQDSPIRMAKQWIPFESGTILLL